MILNEEQSLIQETIRRFSQERIAPRSASFEKAGEYPRELFDELAGLGLMGMTIEPEYGGAKTDYLTYAAALIEIAAADGGLSTILSVHNSLTGLIIANVGSEDQKQRFLPKLASGEWIGGFALTEPHAGSDASSLKVRARKEGDDYVLNGTKQFITSGKIAGLMIVFAVTDQEAGNKGITCFAVETDTPGYEVSKVEDKLGQKASDTCAISFDNMKVPAANRIGGEGEGYKIALSNLETGRVGIAAQSVGMARAALDLAIEYAKERESFGQPIMRHQAVAFRLADLSAKLEAARLMVMNVAALKDAGVPCFKEACMAKLYASEVAEEICSGAIQTLGGYGYLSDYPLEKIYRDVRVCQIYEGTSDIQKLIISRAL